MNKIIIICLTLLCSMAHAQQVWTVEQCINYAIEHNLQVKQALTSSEVSKLGVAQAKFDYIPSLSASAGYNANFGRALDPTTYQFSENQTVNNVNAGVSLSTQLFAGMQKMHRLERSKLDLMATLQDVERIKNEITIAVAAAYLQVLYNKELITTSGSQIALLDEQIGRTRKLVDAGAQPLGALLELQAQLSGEQYNLVSYQNQLATARLNLMQLLELRDIPDFDILTPDLSAIKQVTIASMDDVYSKALSLPQIKGQQLRAQMAGRDVSIAKGRMYPTLSAGANYGSSFSDVRQRPLLDQQGEVSYGKYPFFAQMGDNASGSVQFSLNVPIFNGLTAQRNIKVAKWNQTNAEIGVSVAENKLYKEIQQARVDATGAMERFRSAESSVVSTTESFRYAEQKFAVGGVTSVDYNTAKNNMITAESQMLQAKYEYVFKIKILDFYSGKAITL